MISNTAEILRTQSSGDPIPQYYNPNTLLFEEAEGTGGAIDTNVKTSALPMGASTEIKQDAIISFIDTIETLLSAIKDTTGIKKITDSLPAGSAIIGKFGIDQTTAGTTNGVVVNSSALPTGASTSAKQDTLIAKDFATQATLTSLLAKVISAPSTEAKQDSLVSILTAIRDTSGIKKITDALPSGTNNIGDVDVLTLPSLVAGSALIGKVGLQVAGADITVTNTLPISTIGSSANITGNVQNVTTAGTRVQLPNIPCREITIIARRINTGYIYAGGSNVSASVFGTELASKESFTFAVANANQVWIDSSISGEGISYVAI